MSLDYHIVIPARLASERLPRKPLLQIHGHSLLEHVYRRAMESAARSVVIATDAEEVADCARGFGAAVIMTSAEHQSGSDRIAECMDRMGWANDTLLVNLQGDEPLMPPACLDQVATLLVEDPAADAASLYWPLEDPSEAADPNLVKVVTGLDGAALYFSRSTIPHPRGGGLPAEGTWKRHVGLYAYRASALSAFSRGRPTPLERSERLEQLRFLESGRRIVMAEACAYIPAGVDTPADLERVRAALAATSGQASRKR